MDSLKAKLEAFKQSRVGLFVQKILDDQAPNLAALLAWGTLSALLPLVLGILGLAGLVLRDPERLDQVFSTLTAVLPAQSTELREAFDGVRQAAAGAVGIVGFGLLLFNGSAFFSNMASVFDQAYHVESRNFLMQRVVSIVMLVVVTSLLVVSTLALGLGSIVDNFPLLSPVGPVLTRVISWSISIISAFLVFLLIYKVLPNAGQGWRNVLPGTLVALVLFFVILQLFPIYTALFPPNQAYAVFGVFLVFTFFLYLLGFVFVIGAELNAFLQEPARSVALAEATRRAHKGQAQYNVDGGAVQAETSGDAPALRGGGPLGAPGRSARQQMQDVGDAPGSQPQGERQPQPHAGGGIAGHVLGFIGLIAAVVMLRGGDKEKTTTA
jgi:membrane protein